MIIVYNMNIQMLKGEMFMDEKKEPKYIRGKYSQGQKEATAKYNAKAYDEIKVRVRKGNKEGLKTIAAMFNMSLNNFILNAIDSYIDELEKQAQESGNSSSNDSEELT